MFQIQQHNSNQSASVRKVETEPEEKRKQEHKIEEQFEEQQCCIHAFRDLQQ